MKTLTATIPNPFRGSNTGFMDKTISYNNCPAKYTECKRGALVKSTSNSHDYLVSDGENWHCVEMVVGGSVELLQGIVDYIHEGKINPDLRLYNLERAKHYYLVSIEKQKDNG